MGTGLKTVDGAVISFDAGKNTVSKTVPLQAKNRQVLERLLAARGEPIKIKQLADEIWPGQSDMTNSLHQAVRALRAQLGTEFIKTVGEKPNQAYVIQLELNSSSADSFGDGSSSMAYRSRPASPSPPISDPDDSRAPGAINHNSLSVDALDDRSSSLTPQIASGSASPTKARVRVSRTVLFGLAGGAALAGAAALGASVAATHAPPGRAASPVSSLPSDELTDRHAVSSNEQQPEEPAKSESGCAEIGHQPISFDQWGSGMLQFPSSLNFSSGERLKIRVEGSARRVLVRLLEKGADPAQDTGLLHSAPGDLVFMVADDRLIEVKLNEPRLDVTQISVHGGPRPWGKYELGSENGPARLGWVKRCALRAEPR